MQIKLVHTPINLPCRPLDLCIQLRELISHPSFLNALCPSLSLSLFANLGDFKFSCPIFFPSSFFALNLGRCLRRNSLSLSLLTSIHVTWVGMGFVVCLLMAFGQLVWKNALALIYKAGNGGLLTYIFIEKGSLHCSFIFNDHRPRRRRRR